MKEQLIVAEKFYSIQGEGQTMGVPAVFLRLSACNLLCKSEHWICDSIASWKPKGTKTIFSEVLSNSLLRHVKSGAHLVVTGGEPLLQQKQLEVYFKWFEAAYGFMPIIEVETNGTIAPRYYLQEIVSYWNCSPKLPNSGETAERRIKPAVIEVLNKLNTIYKFVLTDAEQYNDIWDNYGAFIDRRKIVLMPGGETQERLDKTRLDVVDLAKYNNHRYSDRLQVVIWNETLGV